MSDKYSHDWFKIVREVDPDILRKDRPTFVFSNGRTLSYDVASVRKTVGNPNDDVEPTIEREGDPSLASIKNLVLFSDSPSTATVIFDLPNDDNALDRYEISVNGVVVSAGRITTYTQTELPPNTNVTARVTRFRLDGSHAYPLLVVAPTLEETGDPGDGSGPDGVTQPTINAGEFGSSLSYSESWFCEFDGSVPLFDDWLPEDLQDGLHQTGNTDIDENGVAGAGKSVKGKRWSGWVDNQQEVAYIDNGDLVLAGKLVDEYDPTRVPFTHKGVTYYPNMQRIKTPFLSTWGRQFSNEVGGFITHPDSANRTWGPGHYFEAEYDFSQMNTPAYRVSLYLLPAYEFASSSYDGDPANGVEIDMPEYDPSPNQENSLLLKVVGGAVGDTPGGVVKMAEKISNINLQTGRHKIGLLWTVDSLIFYVNGVEVQRDTTRVPQVPSYLVLSREANTGAKLEPAAGELQASPPYLPEDVGIFATNVWENADQINTDICRIGYVRVWSID